MAKQIIADPSTRKISEIYKEITNGLLILQPDFQRRFVWSPKHKENFIDTLLGGYLVPEIFVAQSGIDLDKIEAEEVVVDGQQRLHTIMEYIDEPDDSKVFGRRVKKYKELSPTEKAQFLNYRLLFRDLGDLESEKIKEVFRRINSTQYSLNAVELHNAVYDGEFIETAKNILDEIEIAKLPFFSESQISRMNDLLFVLLILATIEEGGYFVGDKYIEKYVSEYNEEYANRGDVFRKVLNVFNFISDMGLKEDSLWMRKSCYFTLFMEIYNVYPKLKDKGCELVDKLQKLEKLVEDNKTKDESNNEYAKFYSYIYSGTNSRKARVERGNFLKKEIIQELIC